MEFEKIENFRDLAEYSARYGAMAKGLVYRCGDISAATEHDKRLLKEMGVGTIIDLRDPRAWAERPCPFIDDPDIELLQLDVGVGHFFPDEESKVPPMYMDYLNHPDLARRFFRAIIYGKKPVLMHCEAGKDRTGAYAIVLLMANGVSREDMVYDYNLSYDGRLARHEKLVQKRFPNMPKYCYHLNPKTIEVFIDMFLERYGSAENYLDAIGLSESEINAIRNVFGKQERSAGAVVFHENIVLVEHMQLGHYSMPKGHVEEEDGGLHATALREIKEETGLDATIFPGFETDTVYSTRDGVIKRVTWFLATVDNENTKPQPEEIERIVFLSPADAMRVLTHDDDRRVLAQACEVYFKDETL